MAQFNPALSRGVKLLSLLIKEGPRGILRRLIIRLLFPKELRHYGNDIGLLRTLVDHFGIVNQQYRDLSDQYQSAMNAATSVGNSQESPLPSVSWRDSSLRAIAFYLPQFHTIPENDQNWGKGFTEWTNVSKAVPQFVGHDQPRLPGELGYYSLLSPQTIQRQIELARSAGIYGFCFHYYWFSGKKLLEKPLELFLRQDLGDFRFCINWANENWTKRWDGLDQDVIVRQEDRPGDVESLFEDILPILRHPNYIQVGEGVPLLLVYRPSLIGDSERFGARLKAAALNAGFKGLHLVMCMTRGQEDPRPYGLDAACEFPPHLSDEYLPVCNGQVRMINPRFEGTIFDGRAISGRYADWIQAKQRPFTTYRCVFPSWDNEARKPGRGHVFDGITPAEFEKWLEVAAWASPVDRAGNRFIFINAWNEWAEGAYLEPDRRYGYERLNAVNRVVGRFACSRRDVLSGSGLLPPEMESDHAILLHLHFEDALHEIVAELSAVNLRFDLYCTVTPSVSNEAIHLIRSRFPRACFLEVENRGRDVRPFLLANRVFNLARYKAVCKLHAKKSVHRKDGEDWRRGIFGSLLAQDSLDSVEQIRSAGIFAPAPMIVSFGDYVGSNSDRVLGLCKSYGIPFDRDFQFAAGTMFWLRSDILDFFQRHYESLGVFESESGQIDGTLAHAYERFFGLVARHLSGPIHPLKTQGWEFNLKWP